MIPAPRIPIPFLFRERKASLPILLAILLGGAPPALVAQEKGKTPAGRPAAGCSTFKSSGKHRFYEDNPVYRDSGRTPVPWRRGDAASQGFDPKALQATVRVLEQRPEPRAFLVVRHRRMVLEHYFHGARPDESRNVHSLSKSMLSDLVGIAIREGRFKGLGQPLHEILKADFPPRPNPLKLKITLEHLLSMGSGLQWHEDLTEFAIQRKKNWVKAILALKSVSEPGRTFNYSTGMSHLLSAAITRATGMSTCAFAMKHLFGPLGITPEHWGRDPQGIFSGGCNLYLTPREIMRYGLLHLASGKWEGRAIVPAAWCREALRPRHVIDEGCAYGLGWWLFEGKRHRFVLAWGYGGNFLYLFPRLDVAVVVTSDTRKVHPSLDPWKFYMDHLLPALP